MLGKGNVPDFTWNSWTHAVHRKSWRTDTSRGPIPPPKAHSSDSLCNSIAIPTLFAPHNVCQRLASKLHSGILCMTHSLPHGVGTSKRAKSNGVSPAPPFSPTESHSPPPCPGSFWGQRGVGWRQGRHRGSVPVGTGAPRPRFGSLRLPPCAHGWASLGIS